MFAHGKNAGDTMLNTKTTLPKTTLVISKRKLSEIKKALK